MNGLFTEDFICRIIDFLSVKTGKTKSYSSHYAFLICGIFERIVCEYGKGIDSGEIFEQRVKDIAQNRRIKERLTYRQLRRIIFYSGNENTLSNKIEELVAMGYIGRVRKRTHKNSKGQKKRDASYDYSVNFRKLIREMSRKTFKDEFTGAVKPYVNNNDQINFYGKKVYLKKTFI